MKKIIWILLFYFAFAQFASAQPAELNGKIIFSWGDEFNGTTINTDMWNVRDNFDNYEDGKHGGVALAKNVWVAGGLLNCKVVKETHYCPSENVNSDGCYWQNKTKTPYSYTYGRIDAQKKYNQQFGYAEASLYFSPQPGLWPAFWTFVGDQLPTHLNAAEMDIMERVSNSDNNTVTTNLHLYYCPETSVSTACSSGVGYSCSEAPECYGVKHRLAEEVWHATKYAVYWSPYEVIFYINDVEVWKRVNPGVIDPVKFILGMGVSGEDVTDNTILPSVFYVDYIHVYNLYECLATYTLGIGQTYEDNNGEPTILAACTKIDGNGTSGGKMNLVATNSVAILPNFSVKQGGYLEARINNTPGSAKSTDEELPRSEHPLHMQARTNAVVASEPVAAQDVFTVSPNPIVTTAYVNYTIPKQAAVKITLYNMMGIVQDELVNENQPAGEHSYELDASNYKAGMYLLVFEAGGLKQKRKVVITK